MLNPLRRSRWLALVLVLLSPALGGTLLPLLHPCPIDAPWIAAAHGDMAQSAPMAQAAHGSDAHAAHMPSSDDAPASGQHDCSCVGCCAAPPVAAPPAISIAITAVLAPIAPFWSVVHHDAQHGRTLDLLPETTAPPLV